MKIFTAAQIREWDKYSIKEESVASLDLMERAASACFEWVRKHIPPTKHFIICCGTGNNGGDGLVVARLLQKAKYEVTLYILDSKKRSAEFSINLKRLSTPKLKINFIQTAKDFPSISKNDVVVDALFGTGLDRPLKNLAAKLVDHINKESGIIVSIDMPSGLCADFFLSKESIIKATHTLSFETTKLAFLFAENAQFTGTVHLISIGLNKKYYNDTPTPLETIDQELIRKIYRPRNQFAHKYNFGHALIYAGSKNMMGAAVLCTKACIRSGTGLVTIQVTPGLEAIIHTSLPEAITTSLTDTGKSWFKKSAIGIGPGLDLSIKNRLLLKKIINDWEGPLVIDAAALTLLTPNTALLPLRKIRPGIITPHAGEFEKLFGETTNSFERHKMAVKKATTLQCYIILKGHFTSVACPDGTVFFNTTGNAGMATAGSGDVLTGILSGLLAQGYTEKEACIFGVYLHGLAGDIAAEKISQEAMIASDIINCLGEAFKQINNY